MFQGSVPCAQRYARPLCLLLLVIVVAWNIARTRTAASKRKAGGTEADLRALLLGGNRGSRGSMPHMANGATAAAFGAASHSDARGPGTLSPEQLAALLGARDLDSPRSGYTQRHRQGQSSEAEEMLLSAQREAASSDLPLPPHELAALLNEAGHGDRTWASDEGAGWGSGESEDD